MMAADETSDYHHKVKSGARHRHENIFFSGHECWYLTPELAMLLVGALPGDVSFMQETGHRWRFWAYFSVDLNVYF